jgi:hypothetical protein
MLVPHFGESIRLACSLSDLLARFLTLITPDYWFL